MAILQPNSHFAAARGRVGGLVFKEVFGKIVLSQKPSSPRKQSDAQRAAREKFKHASAWARLILTDNERKMHYKDKANALQLPNAYTAAVRDYMQRVTLKRVGVKV